MSYIGINSGGQNGIQSNIPTLPNTSMPSLAIQDSQSTASSFYGVDTASKVLIESHTSLLQNIRHNFLEFDSYKDIIREDSAWSMLTQQILGEMGQDSKKALSQVLDNIRRDQVESLFENGYMAGINAISPLTLPMLRKAWPKIGVKEAIPTQTVPIPQFNITALQFYYVDPITKRKIEMPAVFTNENINSSQNAISDAFIALPIVNYDIMPPSAPVSAGYGLDKQFSFKRIKVECTDAAGANLEVKTVLCYVDNKLGFDPNFRTLRYTVEAVHSSGHKTYDTILGEVDFANGLVTVLQTNTSAPDQTKARIIEVSFNGKLETTLQKQTTEVTLDTAIYTVNIGTGEIIQANIPKEMARDFAAFYKIDVSMSLVDLLAETIAQKTERAAVKFVLDEYDAWRAKYGDKYSKIFNLHPTGQYTGSPTDWLNEIVRTVSYLTESLKNLTNFESGYWACVGHPLDIAVIPGVSWTFNTGDVKDGVKTNYALGALTNLGTRFVFYSSRYMPYNDIYFMFIPSEDRYLTYKYFIYSFSVDKTTEGFSNPQIPTVPAILMNKRDIFKSFYRMIGKLTLMNNNGMSPSNPTIAWPPTP